MSGPSWHVVVNDSAGQGRASALNEELTRLLDTHNIPHKTYITQCEGDGSRIGRCITDADATCTIAVVGGDGTVHELINGIGQPNGRIKIVIVPSGTANAMYHSIYPETATSSTDFDRFLSVEAALAGKDPIPSSTLAVRAGGHAYRSHVVTSTALHAHILETASSPAMRKEFPGAERFRKSAEKHLGTLYRARLSLLPRGADGIQRWNASSGVWQTVSKDRMHVEDDFTYFVSTLVDRFEARFVIAPHSGSTNRPPDALDIVLLRAKQGHDNAAALMKVLNAAFDDGKHISLSEGLGDEGKALVEYYRVSGFSWQPLNDNAKLVCVDGTTLWMATGEQLECGIEAPLSDESDIGYYMSV